MNAFRVGQVIHGFANGAFGRDSYSCRRVEAVGADWIVTRNKSGTVEFSSDFDYIEDPEDRSYCACPDPDELREFERECADQYREEIGANQPPEERRARALRLAEGAPVRRWP